MLTLLQIENSVKIVAKEYPIKKATLFGSYADGTFNEKSDVDIIHAPINRDSILTIQKVVPIYES